MPFVTTRDGVSLFYKDWSAATGSGGGDRRRVYLVHGWPLSADTWDHLAMHLVGLGFRVIAHDRRGFGRSAQPFGGYDYDTFADDLAAVMTATGGDADDAGSVLIGFSMGGGEVARYMSRHRGRGVAGCGLIASVVPMMAKTDDHPDGVDPAMFEQIKQTIVADRPAFLQNFFKDFYGVGWMSSPVSDAYLDWSRQVAMSASLPATVACVDAFGHTDFRTDLPSIAVPTLVIHGGKDDIVPIDISGRAAAAAIADATWISYDDGPHGLFATHPDRLRDDVAAFLNDLDR